MVCITCGAEQFFDQSVPSSIKCQRCGSTVFRQFATPTEPDEATISQLEDQARSIEYGDSSPQTSPDEVRDLGNR
jgi:DNA-directed RNA polymerase subunit RPC12/RpoP